LLTAERCAHVRGGGDEVDYSCWLSNPDVVKFANDKGWGNGNRRPL